MLFRQQLFSSISRSIVVRFVGICHCSSSNVNVAVSLAPRLPGVLGKMFGSDAPWPRHIFTDRGTGMYTSVGKAVAIYAQAVEEAGFHLHWGHDAQRQSSDMGDVLLHETAVVWFR